MHVRCVGFCDSKVLGATTDKNPHEVGGYYDLHSFSTKFWVHHSWILSWWMCLRSSFFPACLRPLFSSVLSSCQRVLTLIRRTITHGGVRNSIWFGKTLHLDERQSWLCKGVLPNCGQEPFQAYLTLLELHRCPDHHHPRPNIYQNLDPLALPSHFP